MASTSRLLLLRRGDHDSRLTEGFESLLDMESMCDVSITCGQYIVKAHRTVLSIFSPFFKRIFDSINNPLHYPFVVIKDMPYADLRAIIDLMYRGEVTVSQDQFGSLKKSAKTLEVSELSDIITSYEEKMDTKPKINFEDISSSARNTRKRGRPKRYCEESDEELKLFQAPKRQTVQTQLIQKQTNKPTNVVKKPLVQKTAVHYSEDTSMLGKPQTATRGGGGHFSYAKQPTAVRGGHSAFTRPQTATRGGHMVTIAKQSIPTRGQQKITPRGGRGGRVGVQTALVQSHSSQDNSVRRGRRGRPPRQSRDSETDLPLATSLPVSLPEPVQVDLDNIFPNYNLNDVTSSTSNSNASIPVTFETTIKREQDSDSEVECIMSGSSPLPSGVVEDNVELTESQSETGYRDEISTNTSLQPIEIPANEELVTNDNELTVRGRDSSQDIGVNEIIDSTIVLESESEPDFRSNIIIKTEKNVSPLNEMISTETNESEVFEHVIDSNINRGVSPSGSQQVCQTNVTPIRTPTIVSLNSETQESNSVTNIPIIRFIKTERISPPVVETSFQSIAFSSNQNDNNIRDTNETSNTEIEVTNETSVPLLTRIKAERLSPTIVCNTTETSEIIIENTDESSVVTSSKSNEQTVETSTNNNVIQSTEEENEIECTYSGNPLLMRSIKVERKSPTQELGVNSETISYNIESSDSEMRINSQISENIQNFEVINDENAIDVQEIAFDCFFSNEVEQQMETVVSEATTSSLTNNSSQVNNSLLEINALQDINNVNQNHDFTNERTQQITNDINRETYLNNELSNSLTANTTLQNVDQMAVMDSVVINSPIHSDEECMLLDSPQQTGYEVTVGSEHLGDEDINDEI